MSVTFLTNEDKTVLEQSITQLSGEIKEFHSIFSEVEDAWLPGIATTSGATADLSPESVVANSSFAHLLVDYKVGDVYMLTAKGGQGGRAWAFVANDGTVLSKAIADKQVTDLVLTCDVDCTLVVHAHVKQPRSLRKKITVGVDALLGEMNARAEKVEQAIEKLETPSYVFGASIDCDYTTPTIPEFVEPEYGKRLAHFYGLYDALVESYPDYVEKIDCDAEMAAAGIVKPENLSAYPMYMYKFSPAFTPDSVDLTRATKFKPIKLFITTGTHGEFMAMHDMYHAMRLVCESWQDDANLEALRWECEIYIIPCSGLVTVDRGWRVNINKVDLNRNCPTSKWVVKGEVGDQTYTGPEAGSEYETKVFMHYLAAIDPHVYIDHHNSSDQSFCSYYAEAKEQSLLNIAASVIAARSRKLRRNLKGVYPENDWTINGFVKTSIEQGYRALYAYEQGYHSVVFETNPRMWYKDGEALPDGADPWSSMAATVAVDGIMNFILLTLKELATRPYIPAE